MASLEIHPLSPSSWSACCLPAQCASVQCVSFLPARSSVFTTATDRRSRVPQNLRSRGALGLKMILPRLFQVLNPS